MPAQKRLRRHHQPVATPRWKQSGECRKQSTIGWPQRGAAFLPAEHYELMWQHEQFDVFGELAASAPDPQPQHSRELTPEERSRGGLHRAAKIRSAKLDAMAEGRPYKPTKRRRLRRSKWSTSQPAVSPLWREPAPAPTPPACAPSGLDAGGWYPVFVRRDGLVDPD
jgi:hypothetical protein